MSDLFDQYAHLVRSMPMTNYVFLCPNEEIHGGGSVVVDLDGPPQRAPRCLVCGQEMEYLDTLDISTRVKRPTSETPPGRVMERAPDPPTWEQERAQRAQEAYVALRQAVETHLPINVMQALVGCVSLLLEFNGARLVPREDDDDGT